MIRQLHKENEICMMGFRKDVPDLLAITDCVLLSSSERMSLVAMEAQACVATAVLNGIFELLQKAKSGFFYNTGAGTK